MNHQEMLERHGVWAMSVLIRNVNVFISASSFPALKQNFVCLQAPSSQVNEKQSLDFLYVK